MLEGFVLLKTRGLHRHVSTSKQECVSVEKVQIVYSFRECMKFMVNTAMQRWGILESSQKCFFVVQPLIYNYINKVNAYMTHTTYMIFDWYVD